MMSDNSGVYYQQAYEHTLNIGENGFFGKVEAVPVLQHVERRLRQGFLRRVFGLLCFQLAIVTAVVISCVTLGSIKTFVLSSPAVLWGSFFTSIATMLALTCSETLRKRHPWNILFLTVFTLSIAVMLGSAAAFEKGSTVAFALGMTMLVTIALVLYTMQSTYDFSAWGGFFFSMLWVLLGFGIIRLAFPMSPIVEVIYAALGAVVFSGLLCVDVWRIVNYAPFLLDEYVACVLELELDVLNLFIFILRMISAAQQDS